MTTIYSIGNWDGFHPIVICGMFGGREAILFREGRGGAIRSLAISLLDLIEFQLAQRCVR